jgi:PilZ domain
MSKIDNMELPPLADRRPEPRKRVLLGGIVVSDDGNFTFNCKIRDVSPRGARIAVPEGQNLPPEFYLIFVREHMAYRAHPVWRRGDEAGLVFTASHDIKAITDPSLLHLAQIWAGRNTMNVNWR